MIKSNILQNFSNQSKLDLITPLIKEYKNFACKISSIQWKLFQTSGRFNEFNREITKLNSKLSERFKQNCQSQIVGMLNSFISNKKNDFKDIVFKSSLTETTKIQLYFINKYNKFHLNEIKMKDNYIPLEIIKLSRKILKNILKKNNKPSFKNISLKLNTNVCKIFKKEENKATSFDIWLKLSLLKDHKPILIPLKTNYYFENKLNGILKNFTEITFKNGEFNFTLMKEIKDITPLKEKTYKKDKIGLDLGLKTLIATNEGDLLGRNYLRKLFVFDKKFQKHYKNCQKNNLPIKTKKHLKRVIKIRGFIKQEIGRSLNKIIKIHNPKEIVVERLDFQNQNLSKRMNRLIGNFGKSIFKEKLNSLNIKITEINPAYTSKMCCKCGYVDENNRRGERFKCKFCLQNLHADVNGAVNIVNRSSVKEINIYSSGKEVLNKVCDRFIERFKKDSLSRRARNLILNNNYFNNSNYLLKLKDSKDFDIVI